MFNIKIVLDKKKIFKKLFYFSIINNYQLIHLSFDPTGIKIGGIYNSFLLVCDLS